MEPKENNEYKGVITLELLEQVADRTYIKGQFYEFPAILKFKMEEIRTQYEYIGKIGKLYQFRSASGLKMSLSVPQLLPEIKRMKPDLDGLLTPKEAKKNLPKPARKKKSRLELLQELLNGE